LLIAQLAGSLGKASHFPGVRPLPVQNVTPSQGMACPIPPSAPMLPQSWPSVAAFVFTHVPAGPVGGFATQIRPR
jgi:hypothetical protein